MYHCIKSHLVILVVCGILLVTSIAQAQSVLYVDDDAPPGGDGLSWTTAFSELQSALDAATSDDRIWVAAGTYKPDYDVNTGTHTGNRASTFQLKNGVVIYGGFVGNEGPATFDLDDRDFIANETILSGDLSGDDIADLAGALACFTISSVPSGPGCDIFDLDQDGDVDSDDLGHTENSYHVVTGNGTDETAVLDGLTITAGKGSYKYGGGMHNENGSPVIANCVFLANYDGGNGGGVYNTNSSPSFINCDFVANRSGFNRGGGMCNKDNSNPLLDNCKFIGNWANRGGGIDSSQSNPTLIDCIFSNNHSTWSWGGGMCNYKNDNPILINCRFSGNSGRYGGGIYNSNCNPTIINCVFSGNSATEYLGGGVRNNRSNPTIINCTFNGNTATEYYGGGIGNNSYSSPTLVNCIFWNNSDRDGIDESSQIYGGTPAVSYCSIQGLDRFTGNGNIGDNPLFIDADGYDDIIGTEDDDLRLQPGSPCIDVGDNSVVPVDISTDLDGNPRILNSTVDMGAYEFQGIPVDLDILPGGCPNPLTINTRNKGKLPMAILGTETFDVSEINVGSISIAGTVLAQKDPSIEDVSAPVENGDECACQVGTDGINDLVVHFSRREVIITLGLDTMEAGTVVSITVEGTLLDGTPFEATDCVTLVPRED